MLAAISLMAAGNAGAAGEHVHAALGRVHSQISCSASSQTHFNHGMALLHHMTYPQARAAFEAITREDPECAMAHWGVAMTLFQPLWPTRPSPAALKRGWDEVQRARALQPKLEREQLLIESAAAFFAEPQSPEYWQRIRRWAEASSQAHAQLPSDNEVALFHALAQLATTPASTSTREHADRAAAILVKVYEREPDHPGVMHYLVHANDVPGRERELLDVTRKYDSIAPNNPHALHMPTHIYTRLGDWNGVIRGNLRAADAALLHPAGEKGELVWDEFAHAIEYLVYGYLQQGADEAALKQLRRLHDTRNIEPSFKTAFHLASTQARYALERRKWEEAANIVPRAPALIDWNQFMWPEAIARFARGLGAAHRGELATADAEIAQLHELESAASTVGEDLFARNIRVLQLQLSSWTAHARGEAERSIELMQEAAELETSTPKHAVTPAPTLPSFELLGDLFLEQNKPSEALDAYERSLKSYPRRFNSLLGGAQAARQSGNRTAARSFYQQLLEVGAAGSRQSSLSEARSYLAQRS